VVLLIFIVLNVFFVLAALAPPLIRSATSRPAAAHPHEAGEACRDRQPAEFRPAPPGAGTGDRSAGDAEPCDHPAGS
jgi:uncharacterized membrane protein